MKTDFGKILKDRRKRLGINQEALAEKTEIDRTYMSKLESENSNPSYSHIKKICKALDLTLAQFFEGREETEIAPAIIEVYQDRITKKQIEQYRVKARVVPIRVIKGLGAFSNSRDIRKELTAKYIYIEKGMVDEIKNILGVEIDKDFILSSLNLKKVIFLVDIVNKELVNFGFYLIETEDSGEIFILRFEEKDDKLVFFNERFSEKGNTRSLLPSIYMEYNKAYFNSNLIRGKIVGIIGRF